LVVRREPIFVHDVRDRPQVAVDVLNIPFHRGHLFVAKNTLDSFRMSRTAKALGVRQYIFDDPIFADVNPGVR